MATTAEEYDNWPDSWTRQDDAVSSADVTDRAAALPHFENERGRGNDEWSAKWGV